MQRRILDECKQTGHLNIASEKTADIFSAHNEQRGKNIL